MNSIFLPLFAAHAWSVSVRQHKICAPIKITIKYKLLLEWLANTLLPHHHQSVHRYESFAVQCNGYNSTLNKIFTLKHTHNCIYYLIFITTHTHPVERTVRSLSLRKVRTMAVMYTIQWIL